MTTTALSPSEFAAELERHQAEMADDYRQVAVGIQKASHAAEIYAQHAHLYTREQVDLLASERDAATNDEQREELKRLWFEAAEALAARDVIQESQDLFNERLAYRATWDGKEVSLNEIGALLNNETDYDRRDALFALMSAADDHFAARDLDLTVRAQKLRSDVFDVDGEVAIAETRMGIDVREFARNVQAVAADTANAYHSRAQTMFSELTGRNEQHPSRAHAQYMRSLHAYDNVYTSERMLDVCTTTLAELGFDLATIPTILPDLEDRPDKTPRACVIPVRVPKEVHLVVRPTGGITDYQAFLHEAGHALHFGLTSAKLPFSFRALAPDNALTEIYSYVCERITHEPAWHMRHFGMSRDEADAVCAKIRFVDAMLFRRYVAKLQYELVFWDNPQAPTNPQTYAQTLSDATEMRYPTSQYVSDMDPGLYAADYLRAWRSSEAVLANLRERFGEEWFTNREAGAWLGKLFERGTEPTNEDVLNQVGSSPEAFEALIHQLSA